MKLHLVEIVVLAFVPLTLRTVLYLVACRVRSLHITLLNAIILAGAGYLLAFIPIPIPFFLHQPIVIGVAMFLFARYTEAELFPDVIFIPLVIELFSALLMDEVLVPMLA
ncbi:MAG: hypothetical protein NTZ35_06280 [Ignavibacteriales bacterium]|nr:hypothetical protein [Ignavibacteriales bacterium]